MANLFLTNTFVTLEAPQPPKGVRHVIRHRTRAQAPTAKQDTPKETAPTAS